MDSLKILLVDDEEDVHDLVREVLQPRHRLLGARDAASAVALAEAEEPDVVLLDLFLGDGPDGFWVLKRLRAVDEDLPVVILSAHHDTDTVVRAMRAGAAHFLDKTPRYDELEAGLERAVHDRRRTHHLESHRLPPIRFLGRGSKVQELLATAREAAAADLGVLILGETGTGKSLLASLIHRWSRQNRGPFVKVNVTSLNPTLIESELFGHEAGSFTSALKRHKGLFEVAHGGTIFLDEVGDFSLASQAKLLHVVDTGEFRRVGSEKILTTSARVVSATNQDVPGLIEAGAFRSDLYYRISGFVLVIPPLREHPESIPVLIENYLGEGQEITDAALGRLMDHSWPGNVRELQRALGRARAFADSTKIDVAAIERGLENRSIRASSSRSVDPFERDYKSLQCMTGADKQGLQMTRFLAFATNRLETCMGREPLKSLRSVTSSVTSEPP